MWIVIGVAIFVYVLGYGIGYEKGHKDGVDLICGMNHDYMRNYLNDYCNDRSSCTDCPLNAPEFNCGLGFGFSKIDSDDMDIIPDEELERYYDEVISNGEKI